MTSVSAVIGTYKTFLEVKYPSHYGKFCNLLRVSPEGAKAEAMLFSLMRSEFDEVRIAEHISSGGADFLCISGGDEFILEVTSLKAEAVASQSGWANTLSDSAIAGSFAMITHMLRTKASGKAAQVSDYPMPRVLAVTCEHIGSDFLIGSHGAETLLTSDTKIAIPIGEPLGETHLTTDLKDSVFFKISDGRLESCRRSISAILLVSLFAHKSLIVGVLHPDPKYMFSIDLLPSVPFLRLRNWPPEGGHIETEWVIRRPRPADFYHREVKLTDDELRSI
ncbi:MAG: hypothetical protein ACLQVJ_11565 [Syntrophobacteraceae bacterium]